MATSSTSGSSGRGSRTSPMWRASRRQSTSHPRPPCHRIQCSRNWSTLRIMLFMVIERFKDGNVRLIGERFKQSGRMLPDGLVYHASWVDSAGARCFPGVGGPHPELLGLWASRWRDLVDFEIVPVLTSSDFWSSIPPEQT